MCFVLKLQHRKGLYLEMLIRRLPGDSACFTGHRPQRLPWGYDESDERHAEMLKRIDGAIDNAVNVGIRHFLCGGALGTDTWAAEEVLAKKRENENITLEIIIPFLGQEKRWKENAQERYRNILLSADGIVVLQPRYTPDCMMARNRHMVENSSHLIAVYDGNPVGGTWQTIKMAVEKRLSLDIINVPMIE